MTILMIILWLYYDYTIFYYYILYYTIIGRAAAARDAVRVRRVRPRDLNNIQGTHACSAICDDCVFVVGLSKSMSSPKMSALYIVAWHGMAWQTWPNAHTSHVDICVRGHGIDTFVQSDAFMPPKHSLISRGTNMFFQARTQRGV